jgi:hypothetical protein
VALVAVLAVAAAYCQPEQELQTKCRGRQFSVSRQKKAR